MPPARAKPGLPPENQHPQPHAPETSGTLAPQKTPPHRKPPVKLKMAPNSGFAILLRSPWWVSFAIAAVIVLVCGALLPSDLAPFAAMGAVPIAVIGCIAAWRQWRAPGAARVQGALQAAAAMPWKVFADTLERAWRAEGHEVQRLTALYADLRITRAHEGADQAVLVAARRWKAATHGVEPLRELHAEVQRQGARAGVYVVLAGTVSEGARSFAKDHGVVLLEGDALAALLLKAPAKGQARAAARASATR